MLLVLAALSSYSFGQIPLVPMENGGELPGAPLCGIYSLAAAAKTMDANVPLSDLLDSKFVSTAKGSTAWDLQNAAKFLGLNALTTKRGTVASLKASERPQILHLNRSRHQTSSRHWVLYLGDENGYARILDVPNRIELRPYADLLAEWDGVAIAIYGEEQSASRFAALMRKTLHLTILLFGICFLRFGPIRRIVCKSRSGVTRVFLIALSVVACVLAGNFIHRVSSSGFHNNPSSVSMVTNFHVAASLPRVSLDYIERLASGDSDGVIVDARTTAAYYHGHIPKAISVPVNGSPARFSSAIERLKSAKSVTVYCQSKSCQWDDIVARHLHFAGIRNVQVYEGGWSEWSNTHLNEK